MKLFTQMFLNRKDGTLSGTKVWGAIVITIGAVVFTVGALVFKSQEIIKEATIFTSLGAAMWGIKNVWSPK